MRRSKARTSARRTYLTFLVGLSIVALLLPGRWTGKLISLVQIIVPFQDAATFATDSVAAAINADPGSISRGTYEALAQEMGIPRQEFKKHLFNVREAVRSEIRTALRDLTDDERECEDEWNALFQA